MDQRWFDRFARLLGGAASRRAGIRAALGGLLGLAALDGADAGHNKGGDRDKGKDGDKDRVRPEGPCGNGSRKANACTKDKQCCTGLCNKKAGKKNLDGKGRCRCVRKNGKCKEDRNCCSRKGQQLSCISGVCGAGSSGIPTSEPCTEGGTPCEDPNAACTTYDEGSGGPAGTYCLLPLLQKTCAKAADCGCNSCYGGTCLTCGCGGCPEPSACASPMVCASGCAHATVQAAVNAAASGGTVTIGPGTYSEDITISGKNLHLLGCPANGDVILKNATQGNRTISVTDGSDFTLGDIVIRGTNDIPGLVSGGGIRTEGGDVCIGLRSRIEGCARFNKEHGGGLFVKKNGNTDQLLHITDAAVFDGNESDSYGGGVFADDGTSVTVDGYARFINNHSVKHGGGIFIDYLGKLTVTDKAEFTDNTADSYGGGVFFYGGGATSPIVRGTFGGKALFSRNTGGSGGGAIAYTMGDNVNESIFIENDVVISDNYSDTYGGGVCVLGAALTVRGNVLFTGNSTTNNSSSYGGGGLYWRDEGQNVELSIVDNVEFSENSTGGWGGAVFTEGAVVKIGGAASFRNNHADGGNGGGGGFAMMSSSTSYTISGTVSISNNSGSNGGGLYLESASTVTLTESVVISGNTASADGGGVYFEQGSTLSMSGGARISGNTATGEGGGAYFKSDGNTLTFADSATITGNTATAGGGGIWIDNSNPLSTTGFSSPAISGNTPNQCESQSGGCA